MELRSKGCLLPSAGVGCHLEGPEMDGIAAEASPRVRMILEPGFDDEQATVDACAQVLEALVFEGLSNGLGVMGFGFESWHDGAAQAARRAFCRLSERQVHRKGWRSQRFQWAMKPTTFSRRVAAEGKLPYRMTRRCRMENQIST